MGKDRKTQDAPERWEDAASDDFTADHAPIGHEPAEQFETDQLELTGADEERLPWLESVDDETYSEYEGYDTSRMLGLFVAGLIALAAIVGGIWWLTNRNADPELVADGSVVPAPTEPYKTAPKNPGGKTFDGTGDSSFAVSEGQNRPAQLGGSTSAPASPAATATPPKPGQPLAATAAPAPATGGVGVQVGAFSSKALADAGWSKLVGQAGGALSGVSHRVVAGTADNGTIYRLQAVASDAAAANALCGRLKGAGIPCQVK